MRNPPRVVAVDHVNVAAPMRAAVAELRAGGITVETVEDPGGAAAFAPELRCAEVLLTSTAFPLGAGELALFSRLRGVAFIASGTNSIDLDAASARRIVVAHSPVVENIDSMAEATVMLMLSALYQLNRSQQLLRDSWERPPERFAHMLSGKTIGLVGFGAIARGVALRLAPWNARIVYTARSKAADAQLEFLALDDLLAASDVVSVHVPLTDSTRGLIDSARLRRFRPGAILVNTSRGGIVDEAAVAEALSAGRLGGAAIDTFAREPIEPENPLLRAPRAILTPHIVGHSIEGNEAIVSAAVENVRALLDGRRPRFVRNPGVFTL